MSSQLGKFLPLLPKHPAVEELAVVLDPAVDLLRSEHFGVGRIDDCHGWSLNVASSNNVALEEIRELEAEK